MSTSTTGIDWVDLPTTTTLVVRATTSNNQSGNGYVNYDNENFDSQNAFDLTTDQFKPSIAGYYLLNIVNFYNGITLDGHHAFGYIYKNGAYYSGQFTRRLTHDNIAAEVSDMVYLNGTSDYIESYYSSPSGYLDRSYFSAMLISGSSTGSGNADNLGNHTATTNISLSNHWISNDGDSEGIYITNDGDVGIGTASPTEELEVNGIVNAKAYKSNVYTAERTADFTTASTNTWDDFPDLTLTITLSEETTVITSYNISMYGGSSYLVTRLLIGNDVKAKSISANDTYWSITPTRIESLGPGTHIVKVQYRTPAARTINPSDDWQNAYLQVTILGNQ